jgi:hypothetical protein
MRKRLRTFAAALVGALLLTSTAFALYPGRYNVTLTRKEANVYVDDNTGLVVITHWCTYLARHKNATLIWKGEAFTDNRVIFSAYDDCEVRKVH